MRLLVVDGTDVAELAKRMRFPDDVTVEFIDKSLFGEADVVCLNTERLDSLTSAYPLPVKEIHDTEIASLWNQITEMSRVFLDETGLRANTVTVSDGMWNALNTGVYPERNRLKRLTKRVNKRGRK